MLFTQPLSVMFIQLTKEQEWYQKSRDNIFPIFINERGKTDSRIQESKHAYQEQNKPNWFYCLWESFSSFQFFTFLSSLYSYAYKNFQSCNYNVDTFLLPNYFRFHCIVSIALCHDWHNFLNNFTWKATMKQVCRWGIKYWTEIRILFKIQTWNRYVLGDNKVMPGKWWNRTFPMKCKHFNKNRMSEIPELFHKVG